MENVDEDGIQVLAELKDGKEYGDPTPVAPPVGMTRGLTMAERMQQMIRREVSRRAEELGLESLEEANDFDIPDDPLDPSTPYEEYFDPVEKAAAERLRTEELRDRVDARHKELRARKYPQEEDDGSSSVDEGRSEPAVKGAGKPGKVDENKRPAKSSVPGGSSKAGSDNSGSEE